MKREIVFDSSTAILLAKIGLLATAAEKFKIIFPETVEIETTKKKDSFDSKLIARLINEDKVRVFKLNKKEIVKLTEDFNIEQGEAEALLLAVKKKCIIATDDGPSIKVCKIFDIKFMTAMHFLIYFNEIGLLEREMALEKLKTLEKYGRYNYDLLKDAKRIVEGDKNG